MRSRPSAPAPTPGTLREHRDSPALLLALVGNHAMKRLRAAHTANRLKPRQFEILGLLEERGSMAQTDLAATMAIAPTMLVSLLKPLEEEGWIRRSRDVDDRRRHVIDLTAAGLKRFTMASEAQLAVEDELFGELDEGDRIRLRDILLALRDDLIADDSEHCASPGSLSDTGR